MTETHHKNPNKGNLHRISCTGQGTHILARGSCTAVSTEILAGRSCTRPSTLHTGRFQKLPWYFFAVLLQWPLPSHLLGVCVPPSLSSRSSIFLLPCSLRLAAGEDSETVQSVRLWLFLVQSQLWKVQNGEATCCPSSLWLADRVISMPTKVCMVQPSFRQGTRSHLGLFVQRCSSSGLATMGAFLRHRPRGDAC